METRICIWGNYFEEMGAEIAGKMRMIMLGVMAVMMERGHLDACIAMAAIFHACAVLLDCMLSTLCIV